MKKIHLGIITSDLMDGKVNRLDTAICGHKGERVSWVWMSVPKNVCKKCLKISDKWPKVKI